MGDGFNMGFQAGNAIAKGVADWRAIQLDRQNRKEFDGAMALAAQRRGMIASASQVDAAAQLEGLKAQVQRSPQSQQAARETGEVDADGQPVTEQVIRTPEGDIPIAQLLQLQAQKQQSETQRAVAEVDLIMDLQSRYPSNPYVKQWAASTYAGIQQKQQIRARQVEAQRLQLDTLAAGLAREQFEQEKLKYAEQPGREQAKETFQADERIRSDAARIEAEKRAKLETDAAAAQNKPAKAPTEAQSKAVAFGRRVEQAIGEFASINYDRAALSSGVESSLPNFAKSESAQRIDQAERNFLNAVLRKESGALISPSEFANGEKQYFPRAGDKPETVKQKARNRQLALEALKGEAGEFYQTVAPGETGKPAGSVPPEVQSVLDKYRGR